MSKDYAIPNTCQVIGLNEIYLKYFGYKTSGFFVDVGAYDGIQHSNTWALAEAGWAGLCYEPVEEYYQKCIYNHKKHSNVKTLQTCIGNKIGTVPLYISDVYSTYYELQPKSELRKHLYANSPVVISPITTLDKSLRENEVAPNFDILSLDVEGAEIDVLSAFTLGIWKPKMCIVEAHEKHIYKEMRVHAQFINKYFESMNYNKIYSDDTNNIYISEN